MKTNTSETPATIMVHSKLSRTNAASKRDTAAEARMPTEFQERFGRKPSRTTRPENGFLRRQAPSRMPISRVFAGHAIADHAVYAPARKQQSESPTNARENSTDARYDDVLIH